MALTFHTFKFLEKLKNEKFNLAKHCLWVE